MHKAMTTAFIGYAHNTSHKETDHFLIHTHPTYEIYYFLQGEADYLIDGKEYPLAPHTLLVITPGVFHGVRVRSQEIYERHTLHFDPNVLSVERRHLLMSAFPQKGRTAGSPTESVCCMRRMERSGVLEILRAFEACADQEEEMQKALSPVLTEALLTLLLLHVQPLDRRAGAGEGRHVPRAQKDIIEYLDGHFTEAISLDALSERFYISKHYLNRAFKKATGTTVMDYLIHKRVTYVQQLLINGIPASQAASQAGFGDYTSFYRAYVKRFGHAPSQDRAITEKRGEGRKRQGVRGLLEGWGQYDTLEEEGAVPEETVANPTARPQ